MAKATVLPWQRAILVLTSTLIGVIVLVGLYFGKAIFVPMALAIYLTFLLSPFVTWLQRRGLGRVPSVTVVVLIAAMVLAGVGYLVARQMMSLPEELQKYSENIKAKGKTIHDWMASLWGGKSGSMAEDLWNQVTAPITPQEDPSTGQPKSDNPAEQRPTVIVRTMESRSPWLAQLGSAAGSIWEIMADVFFASVLLLFMLLKREDMRDRLMRLVGHGRLTMTTKAVDEAGHRVSRFLVTQAAINVSYGLVVAAGLWALGIDHALLWGFFVALMRYIPYIGVWIAIVPPLLLSLAQFTGWWHPVVVIGAFLVMEIITGNILEPRFFGKSLGVSEVALLVAAGFWAFMWGPIGLVLSSPLTVVLVVLGKYVPQLEFLDVLLGDEPALDPNIGYYQRLLARDQDEASQVALEQATNTSAEQVYDSVLIPTLNYVKRDRERDALTEDDEQFIYEATQEIIAEMGEQQVAEAPKEDEKEGEQEKKPVKPAVADSPVRILACPAHSEGDRLALEMLQQLLDPARWELDIMPVKILMNDLITQAVEKHPLLICISALPPGGLAHARLLCKRLRKKMPKVKIAVGRWGLLSALVEEDKAQLRAAGVDEVETTLLAMRDRLTAWLPVLEVMEDKKDKEHAESVAARDLADTKPRPTAVEQGKLVSGAVR
jgi:predicted PurR-regulated permease PerM